MCECGKKTCWNCEGTPESKQRVPHKHAALIKAWADGAQIECKQKNGIWYPIHHPSWDSEDYRIKPEPKPDEVKYARLPPAECGSECGLVWSFTKYGSDNIRAVFDGETGKLKSVVSC